MVIQCKSLQCLIVTILVFKYMSMNRSASVAEQVGELSERSGRLLSLGGRRASAPSEVLARANVPGSARARAVAGSGQLGIQDPQQGRRIAIGTRRGG